MLQGKMVEVDGKIVWVDEVCKMVEVGGKVIEIDEVGDEVPQEVPQVFYVPQVLKLVG